MTRLCEKAPLRKSDTFVGWTPLKVLHTYVSSYKMIEYIPSLSGKCFGWVCLDQIPLKCIWYRAFPQAQHVLRGSERCSPVPSPNGAIAGTEIKKNDIGNFAEINKCSIKTQLSQTLAGRKRALYHRTSFCHIVRYTISADENENDWSRKHCCMYL